MPLNMQLEAIQWLRPLIADVWLRRPGVVAIPVHVEFVMDQVHWERFFSQYFRFTLSLLFTLVFYTCH
jgi:hypothetical protein